MSISISRSEIPDLKLSGREVQTSINVDKYNALAYGTPIYGDKMLQQVENHWTNWLQFVQAAPWLYHWKNSDLLNKPGISPCGKEYDGPVAKLAETIFVDAVWGFGVDKWLEKPYGPNGTKNRNYTLVYAARIMQLQKVKALSYARAYTWDDKLYRGCGLPMPIEYGDLDRWLEPLWSTVLEEVRVEEVRRKTGIDWASK